MPASIRLDQYIPASSLLHRLDPRIKIGLTAVLLTAVVNAGTAGQLIWLVLTVFGLITVSGVRFRVQAEGLKPFLPVIILTPLLVLLLVKGEPIYKWGIISLSGRAVSAASIITIRLILVLWTARLLTLTTPPLYLLEGLAQILKPLAKIGFPVQETVMIMGIALCFIPIIIEETNHLVRAQAARGGSCPPGLKGMLSLLVPLFQISLRRAAVLSEAMESRGYTGQERSSLYELNLAGNDYRCLGILALWLLMFLIFKTWGIPL